MNRSPTMPVRRPTDSILAQLAAGLSLAVLLQGCATPGATPDDAKPVTAPASTAKPTLKSGANQTGAEKRDLPEPVLSPAQQALNGGIEAYNKGDFNNAIKRLGAPEIMAGDKGIQVEALKYSAFSYCVTKRQTRCIEMFVKAFKLDPAFELAAGEKGHPLWTQAFERAKKTKTK